LLACIHVAMFDLTCAWMGASPPPTTSSFHVAGKSHTEPIVLVARGLKIPL
jgi:hypothetical protein